MKLLRTAVLTATTALVSLPALAETKVLSSVEVEADLSAYSDSNALEFWPTLDKDLSQAIAQRVEFDDSSEAPRVRVEINRIAIDGDTILPDTGEFNQLEGTVQVYEGLNAGNANSEVGLSNDEAVQSFPFRLTAETAEGEAPEGWILIPPSKDDFYSALVNAYADGVLERIKAK